MKNNTVIYINLVGMAFSTLAVIINPSGPIGWGCLFLNGGLFVKNVYQRT